MSRDYERIIDITGRIKIDGGIVVEKFIQSTAADGHRGDHLTIIKAFFSIGDSTSGVEMHDVISEKLRVNTEIIFVGKGADSCLRGGIEA